ncbi:hypothetical protein BDV29DRAFT_168176 [Aspergillus leporis]|uniref:Uncharacterized protein n=1 Tax=Aspergillus leporis TaxID=41062 RepID=A0A5N5X9L0_9EURO|nr:hypothetical protein BDV29DRAFT_168176 [Aspergillus leporis]
MPTVQAVPVRDKIRMAPRPKKERKFPLLTGSVMKITSTKAVHTKIVSWSSDVAYNQAEISALYDESIPKSEDLLRVMPSRLAADKLISAFFDPRCFLRSMTCNIHIHH